MPAHDFDILVVDDDLDDCYLIAEGFRLAQSKVLCLQNGVEAIKVIDNAETLPKLIITDLNMPKLGGFELIRSIRNRYSIAQLPIVVLATSASEEDIELAYELGVNSYFRKPLEFNRIKALCAAISTYWDMSFISHQHVRS